MGQSPTDPSPPLQTTISQRKTSLWVSPPLIPVHRQTTWYLKVYVSVHNLSQSIVKQHDIYMSDKWMGQFNTDPSPPL